MGEAGCQFYRKLMSDGKSLITQWFTEILTAQDFAKKAEEEAKLKAEREANTKES